MHEVVLIISSGVTCGTFDVVVNHILRLQINQNPQQILHQHQRRVRVKAATSNNKFLQSCSC